MAETLKDVIAKLKAQQSYQSSTPSPTPNRQEIPRKVERVVEKPVEKPVPEENLEDFDDEYDEDDEEIEESPTPKAENSPKTQQIDTEEIKRIQETISSLHDNGVFRLELLNNFQQINKNLTIITGILLELTGYGKENTGN